MQYRAMRKDTKPQGQGAQWRYKDISLEISAHLIHTGSRYPVPTYAGEGWGHALLKAIIAAHLLHWGYKWENILWERDPQDVAGRRRADILAKGGNSLPTFWFECGCTESDKLRELVSVLSREVRVVNVLPLERFRGWWNGEYLGLASSLRGREKGKVIRQHRAESSVIGVEYWAVYETSASARILFAVQPEGNGHYTYFETGEGWSLSHISFLSRRTDRWAPLIPRLTGEESGHDKYLPRKKDS